MLKENIQSEQQDKLSLHQKFMIRAIETSKLSFEQFRNLLLEECESASVKSRKKKELNELYENHILGTKARKVREDDDAFWDFLGIKMYEKV